MVSVIVPVYNGAHTIGACLQSLLALHYPPDAREILVVDNGSTDHTRAVLGSFGDAIRLFSEPTRGPAAARNRALREASGGIVAFTDADCVVHPDWLSQLVRPLQDTGVGAVGGAIRALPPSSAIDGFCERIYDHDEAINTFSPPYVISMNWASPRALLQQLGGFDTGFRRCEDVDLSYRMHAAGYRFVFSPTAVVYHRHERTLYDLFEKGFLHGFYSVPVIRKHRALLNPQRGRVTGAALKLALAGVRDYVAGTNPTMAACVAAFNGGKQLGKAVGSARFLSLEL
jgi:GT2 family glycosyltransferase